MSDFSIYIDVKTGVSDSQILSYGNMEVFTNEILVDETQVLSNYGVDLNERAKIIINYNSSSDLIDVFVGSNGYTKSDATSISFSTGVLVLGSSQGSNDFNDIKFQEVFVVDHALQRQERDDAFKGVKPSGLISDLYFDKNSITDRANNNNSIDLGIEYKIFDNDSFYPKIEKGLVFKSTDDQGLIWNQEPPSSASGFVVSTFYYNKQEPFLLFAFGKENNFNTRRQFADIENGNLILFNKWGAPSETRRVQLNGQNYDFNGSGVYQVVWQANEAQTDWEIWINGIECDSLFISGTNQGGWWDEYGTGGNYLGMQLYIGRDLTGNQFQYDSFHFYHAHGTGHLTKTQIKTLWNNGFFKQPLLEWSNIDVKCLLQFQEFTDITPGSTGPQTYEIPNYGTETPSVATIQNFNDASLSENTKFLIDVRRRSSFSVDFSSSFS